LDTSKEDFRPLHQVTKAEFLKLLYEGSGYHPDTLDNLNIEFYDVTGNEWFAPYVRKALDEGLVTFNQENPNFNAHETYTQIQAIKMIFSVYNLEFNESTIQQVATEMRLFSNYKNGFFDENKAITRAQTLHILYQLHSQSAYLHYSFEVNRSNPELAMIEEIYNKLINEYIDKDSLNKNDLIYRAIEGLMSEVEDPYTIFMEPNDSDTYLSTLNGAYDGIGIYLHEENGQIYILTPLKGSPAEEAGLKPNDLIVKINGKSITENNSNEIINLLRGPAGSTVSVTIKRDNILKTYKITRSNIDIPYVESEMIDDIAIIYYYQFTGNSNLQFYKEVHSLLEQNPKGFILDLRNNPGGYLSTAGQLISYFVETDTNYVTYMFGDGSVREEKTNGTGEFSDYPLVILINEGSASASEITALALKEIKGISLVGKTSFGKGKIQEIVNFDDGSSLKISTAKWVSPNGTYINDIGITPDYIIEPDENDENDAQLKKALELIQ
jgi:carboxyl-terminal processing protease